LGAILGLSMPRFYTGIIFQMLFFGWLGWFPLASRLSDNISPPPTFTGLYLIDSLIAMQWQTFFDAAWHIFLPAMALGLSTLSQVTRLLRSDIIKERRENYVLAAHTYGLPKNLIIYKYILRNAFTSSLTIIGLAFGFLLGNAFLIETVFAWPGMARYGVDAIIFQDFNAIVGVVVVVGVGFVIINLIVDVLYGYLDPRVRLGAGDSQ
jgi:peptide/nickel transport system permease protein